MYNDILSEGLINFQILNMEWYKGGVGEAIAEAKSKKAIFAVIIKGI